MNKRKVYSTMYQIGIGESLSLFANYAGANGQEFPKLHSVQFTDSGGTGILNVGYSQLRTETSFAGGSFVNSIDLYGARGNSLDFGEHPVEILNGLSLVNVGPIILVALVVYSFGDYY